MSEQKPEVSFEEAVASQIIAKTVSKSTFYGEFAKMQKRIEKQESQSFGVIVGVLVAAFLVYVASMIQMSMFTANYRQQNEASETIFQDGLEKIRAENKDMEMRMRDEMRDVRQIPQYTGK